MAECEISLENLNAFFDLPYYDLEEKRTGDSQYIDQMCKLDLVTPQDHKNFPTLVWFHGGGLVECDKHFLPGLDNKKIAIATVDYRFSGEKAQCPDYLYDAAAAISWVIRHIAEYGGDPKQIYVAGHSAGAYLATMMGVAPKYLEFFGVKTSDIQRFMPISGQMTTHAQILNERRKNDPTVPAVVLDEFAPIALASKETPPFTIMVGDPNLDMPTRAEENRLFAATLKRRFGHQDVQCYSFESFGHVEAMTPGTAVINNFILAQIEIP